MNNSTRCFLWSRVSCGNMKVFVMGQAEATGIYTMGDRRRQEAVLERRYPISPHHHRLSSFARIHTCRCSCA